MPDPTPPQSNFDPAQLEANQAAQKKAANAQNQQDQDALQKAADNKKIFRRIQNKTIKPGALINFQYNFYKHDFSPLCLVGKIWGMPSPGMVSGLNLHYLTFRYIKYLLKTFCGKNFHYGLIKGNKYIVNAYRSYKKDGRRNVHVMDCEFLNDMLNQARSFKPGELEAMRENIQKQLRDKMHPNADQVANQYQSMIHTQPPATYNTPGKLPDGRINPTNVTPPQE